MALVDDLIADGTVIQDQDDVDKVVFTVDVHIKKSAINAGAFLIFAKQYGYTEKVKEKNDEGVEVEIDNPMDVYTKCRKVVLGFISDVFQAAIINKASSDSKVQADNLLKSLL